MVRDEYRDALSPQARALRAAHAVAAPARSILPILLVVASVLVLLVTLLFKANPAAASERIHQRTHHENLIAIRVKHMINQERAAHGLPALTMRADLRESARRHDIDMMRANEMAHTLPGEKPFGRRIDQAGYDWQWAGENIAWNSKMTWAGVAQLQNLMYHEQAPNNGHRLNILDKHFTDVGVDVYMDRAHHKVWLTADFGTPADNVRS